jgi:hypothetical protein
MAYGADTRGQYFGLRSSKGVNVIFFEKRIKNKKVSAGGLGLCSHIADERCRKGR